MKLGEQIKHFKAEIILKESAKPVFHKAYALPYQLQEKVGLDNGNRKIM